MKKVFYLKNCTTCKKIMGQYNLSDWELRELKSENITEQELDELHKITHSYEKLFSKKSMQIKVRNIETSSLMEVDFKNLILDHYSFLKRPVFLSGNKIFVGSDKINLQNLELFFNNK